MFIYQGQKSFYLWNKINPEIDEINRIITFKIEMKKIGVTGSIASGKTTASKILSRKYGPLFSADEAIKKLYEDHFKKLIIKSLKLKTEKI